MRFRLTAASFLRSALLMTAEPKSSLKALVGLAWKATPWPALSAERLG